MSAISRWVAGGLSVLFFGSCGHFVTKSRSYSGQGGVEVNGAMVRSAVRPMGGEGGFALSAMVYTAGSGSLDGPFLWRIEATGEEGVHEALTVHRLKVTTKLTQRSEWYPQRHLGVREPFKGSKGAPGKVFAQFQVPGKLEAYPDEDGSITILADLSVQSARRTVRQVVKFEMDPSLGREVDFVFLPAEIVKGFGEEDPQEWKW